MNWQDIKERHDLLSLLVAAIAVFLSQFPPVYQWFYSPEIEVKNEQSFALFPNVYSGIAISKYYSSTNIGEEPGRVKSVHLFFTDREGELLHEVRAQGYRLHGVGQFGQSNWEQFTELALKPGENWSHLVSFNKRIRNYELDGIRDIQEDIKNEREEWEYRMEEEGWDLDKFDSDMPQFEISKELIVKLKSETEKKIPWFKEGDYILHEVTLTGETEVIHSYEFSINEFHMLSFADSMDGWSYGVDSNSLSNTIFEIEPVDTDIPKIVSDKVKEYNK